ncbi:MAG: efflux RND transporter periplasmic adaptor subunit [Candidatus Thiodiazotropha lotti]|nr:efflux RND transporter periplasmic adaptor subunit [Candidatus Thiodiazotropha lotti]MCW4183026.1 efflux RND transporter periplasmic adaptor subunit [Candidatus Thiodiazotropha weberae]
MSSIRTKAIYPLLLLILFSHYSWAEEATQYTCPMHPHYIATDMGSCPICGMDLVALETAGSMPSAENEAGERAVVTIAPETIQNMGVRYGRAEMTAFGSRVRAYGVVAESERLRSEVSSRVAGWLERLSVTAVGDPIKKGDLLYQLFSPDLVAAQRDYVSALQGGNQQRIRSAAVRLEALGVSKGFIKSLRKQGKVVDRVPFYAVTDGTLSELRVREGAYVRPGETLAVIQDYSTVWINAAVAEKDLSEVSMETPVQVILPNLPGQVIESQIDYIHPTVDPDSRTGRVRLALSNQAGRLRPGAYADVLFEIDLARRLAVEESALLIGETGPYLVVALGDGRFQPRSVRTGRSSGGFTEILEGVDSEDLIVVSGQFLIDSESALRESFQKLQRIKLGLDQLPLSQQQLAMLDHMIDAALYIHEALVDGYDISPDQLQPAREIRDLLWPGFGATRLGPIMQGAAEAIELAQQARTESALQQALHQLVSELQPWVLNGRRDHYQQQGVRLYQDQQAQQLWLQLAGEPVNPYGAADGELVE